MCKNPYHWLKAFATTLLPGHLLAQPQALFEAVKSNNGTQYLYNLSCRYAEENQYLPAPEKCIQLNYTNRYKNIDALFIDTWPGLQLQESPVYLAAIRRSGSHHCRVFRLHYPTYRQLYMSEFQLEEKGTEPAELLSYEHAISLIFSYTLAAYPDASKQDLLQKSNCVSGKPLNQERVQ